LCRNSLLKYVIERKIDVRGTRGRRCKQLLDLKEKRTWKRQHQIALCGELALEEAMDLP
jgi:hypothetical protein